MKTELSHMMDEAIMAGAWDEILSSDTDVVLGDLLKLSTDYSCHGCTY